MYAISHAASALVLKRRYPEVAIWPLLISVQAIEVGWVVLSLLGLEHSSVREGKIHLDFLPYSHSVGTTLALGLLALALLWRVPPKAKLALAVALGVVSHVVLDIIQHDHDIALLPVGAGPRFGLGLGQAPSLNFAVELAFGVACWWIFRGGRVLLAGIIAFNVANLPTMFQPPMVVKLASSGRAVLPLIIALQIVATWGFVAWASQRPVRPSPETAS